MFCFQSLCAVVCWVNTQLVHTSSMSLFHSNDFSNALYNAVKYFNSIRQRISYVCTHIYTYLCMYCVCIHIYIRLVCLLTSVIHQRAHLTVRNAKYIETGFVFLSRVTFSVPFSFTFLCIVVVVVATASQAHRKWRTDSVIPQRLFTTLIVTFMANSSSQNMYVVVCVYSHSPKWKRSTVERYKTAITSSLRRNR